MIQAVKESADWRLKHFNQGDDGISDDEEEKYIDSKQLVSVKC